MTAHMRFNLKVLTVNVDNRYAIVDANHEEICIFGHL